MADDSDSDVEMVGERRWRDDPAPPGHPPPAALPAMLPASGADSYARKAGGARRNLQMTSEVDESWSEPGVEAAAAPVPPPLPLSGATTETWNLPSPCQEEDTDEDEQRSTGAGGGLADRLFRQSEQRREREEAEYQPPKRKRGRGGGEHDDRASKAPRGAASGRTTRGSSSTVIKLRELPLSAQEEDIEACLTFGMDPKPKIKEIFVQHYRAKGMAEAFVVFATPEQASCALLRNGDEFCTNFGDCFAADMIRSDVTKMERARDWAVGGSRGGGGKQKQLKLTDAAMGRPLRTGGHRPGGRRAGRRSN